jgi:hypothetical protein
VPREEQEPWILRSLDVAIECGATAVSLVPTRTGNGALDALEQEGRFVSPLLADLDRWFTAALRHARGRTRVFLDLWEIERFANGGPQPDACCERLAQMNREQRA